MTDQEFDEFNEATGKAQRWLSPSGRVCVQKFVRSARDRRRVVYYVQVRRETPSGACWDYVSWHTSERAAFAAAKRVERKFEV